MRIRVRPQIEPVPPTPAARRLSPRFIKGSVVAIAVAGFFLGLWLGLRHGSFAAREEIVSEMRRNSTGKAADLATRFASSNWPAYPQTHIVSLANLPGSRLQCSLDHTRIGAGDDVDAFRSGWYRTCLWGEKDVTLDITEARKYEGAEAAGNIKQFYRRHLGWESAPDYSPQGIRRVWVQEVQEGPRSLLLMRFQLFINRAVE